MAHNKDGYAVEDGQIDRSVQPRKTRSERRRETSGSDALASELVSLPAEELARIPLSDVLRDAVDHARGIRRHAARRRQLAYLSKLLRAADTEPIRDALEAEVDGSAFDALERWRTRILTDGADAIEAFLDEHPSGDRQRLRQLARNATRTDDKGTRARRQLFQLLREAAGI